MRVPDNVSKCVAFLAYVNHATGEHVPVGSAFFLGRADERPKADPVYVVTAKHVISGLKRKGVEAIELIVNLKDGGRGKVDLPLANWFVDPEDRTKDVAIYKTGVPEVADQLVYPMSGCLEEDTFAKQEVGLGDNVFITGLFRHHFGKRQNIPIIRTGNLAALDDEKIGTREFGDISAYLIEARSIGGLSGSPVFLNLGVVRSVGGAVKFSQTGEPIYYLLGLVHGHYDVPNSEIDANVSRRWAFDRASKHRYRHRCAVLQY
jgi:hypothetical protein